MTAKRPESAMPEVSQDKHYSVNVNLKPLFGAEESKTGAMLFPKLTLCLFRTLHTLWW